MHHRYTTPRRAHRRQSPLSVVVGITLLLIIAGCTAYGATSAMRLVAEGGFAGSSTPTHGASVGSALDASLDATDPPSVEATPDPTAEASPEPAPRRTRAPSPSPSPEPTPRLRPRPHKGPFQMDVYRRNAMVSELENYWCMPAAMQTMMNIMGRGRPDRSYATQRRLYGLARRLSTDRLDGKGAEPIGWARGLTRLGYGRFVVSVHTTRGDAIRTAAKALRITGRPVGIIAWRGAHSWVMSGFKSTADPALTNRFKVTQVAIEDVWYPRISSIWGASTPPDTWIPVERLPQDFLPYRRPGVRYPGMDGRFLLVLPSGRDRGSR